MNRNTGCARISDSMMRFASSAFEARAGTLRLVAEEAVAPAPLARAVLSCGWKSECDASVSGLLLILTVALAGAAAELNGRIAQRHALDSSGRRTIGATARTATVAD